MAMNRRTFVGMGVAAAAATQVAAAAKVAVKAAKPTIDPLKAPRTRFWVAALTPMDSHGDFDNAANDEMLGFWKSGERTACCCWAPPARASRFP